MNREQKRILRRAARMLRKDGVAMFEACKSAAEPWACGNCPDGRRGGKCGQQRNSEAMMKTAAQLRDMANA